jgi:DNA repair protein RecO (recombination protein O)
MMPLHESEAIVLRSFPLGEGDRLVSFLDRQSGRLRGVAKGARLPKSRFGSTLELLSHIRIWYFERETRDLVRINQCELIESFLDVQRDYQAGVALALLSEVTEAILGERETADPQFRLVLLTARAIRIHGASPAVLAYFALWTARLGGWLSPLDRCTQCGRIVQGEPLYASPGPSGGFHGLLCGSCRDVRMRPLSPASLAVGRQALSGTLEKLLAGNPSIEGSSEIASYALDILEHHIEKRLVSREMLEMGKRKNG